MPHDTKPHDDDDDDDDGVFHLAHMTPTLPSCADSYLAMTTPSLASTTAHDPSKPAVSNHLPFVVGHRSTDRHSDACTTSDHNTAAEEYVVEKEEEETAPAAPDAAWTGWAGSEVTVVAKRMSSAATPPLS